MIRLREHSLLHSCVPILSNILEDLKIVYHNCRSLHLHIKDLITEKNMLDSDIVAVAESRLVQSDRNDEYSIPGFRIYRFDDEHNQDARIRTCRGIVLYSKIDFQHLQRISLGLATEAVLACFSFCGRMQQLVFPLCITSKSKSDMILQYFVSLA